MGVEKIPLYSNQKIKTVCFFFKKKVSPAGGGAYVADADCFAM